ncbi:hypothetical protein LTR95_010890 [Oleoguttula sp. CCFEE 5521]
MEERTVGMFSIVERYDIAPQQQHIDEMPSGAAKRKANVEEPPMKRQRGIKIQKAAPTPEPPRSETPVMKLQLVDSVASTPKTKPRGVKLKDRVHSEEPSPAQAPVIKQEIKAESVEGPIVKLEDVKIKQEAQLEEPAPRVEYTPESKPKQSIGGDTPPVKPPKALKVPAEEEPEHETRTPIRMRDPQELKQIKAEIYSAIENDYRAMRTYLEKAHVKAQLTGDNTAKVEAKIALDVAKERYAKGLHVGCRYAEFKGFVVPVKRANNEIFRTDKAERIDRQLESMVAVYEEDEMQAPAPKALSARKLITPNASMTPQVWDALCGKAPGSSKIVASREQSSTLTPDRGDRSISRPSASYTPQPEQTAMASWELGSGTEPSIAKWEWKNPGGWVKIVATQAIKVEAGEKRKLESIEELGEDCSPDAKRAKLV